MKKDYNLSWKVLFIMMVTLQKNQTLLLTICLYLWNTIHFQLHYRGQQLCLC